MNGKRAHGLQPLGLIAAEVVADMRFRRQVERLHRLGPRSRRYTSARAWMADQEHPKPLFAAIPLQAIGDRRLNAAHFQVLTAIAWHDQFGANGIGCYASLKTLAKETGLAQTTVSECTGDLEAFGLLAKARHPLNRRTKVYSLIYKGNPRILPETGNCPTDHGAVLKNGNRYSTIVSESRS